MVPEDFCQNNTQKKNTVKSNYRCYLMLFVGWRFRISLHSVLKLTVDVCNASSMAEKTAHQPQVGDAFPEIYVRGGIMERGGGNIFIDSSSELDARLTTFKSSGRMQNR